MQTPPPCNAHHYLLCLMTKWNEWEDYSSRTCQCGHKKCISRKRAFCSSAPAICRPLLACNLETDHRQGNKAQGSSPRSSDPRTSARLGAGDPEPPRDFAEGCPLSVSTGEVRGSEMRCSWRRGVVRASFLNSQRGFCPSSREDVSGGLLNMGWSSATVCPCHGAFRQILEDATAPPRTAGQRPAVPPGGILLTGPPD